MSIMEPQSVAWPGEKSNQAATIISCDMYRIQLKVDWLSIHNYTGMVNYYGISWCQLRTSPTVDRNPARADGRFILKDLKLSNHVVGSFWFLIVTYWSVYAYSMQNPDHLRIAVFRRDNSWAEFVYCKYIVSIWSLISRRKSEINFQISPYSLINFGETGSILGRNISSSNPSIRTTIYKRENDSNRITLSYSNASNLNPFRPEQRPKFSSQKSVRFTCGQLTTLRKSI